MKKLLTSITVAGTLVASGCLINQAMYGSCDVNGEPFGLAGTGPGAYVLHCRSGEWVPIMTALEYVELRQGKPVNIAPVPDRATITNVAPEHIPEAGAEVTVAGKGLAGATAVWIGGKQGTVLSSSATEVKFTAPAHIPGNYELRIETPQGTAAKPGAITYKPAPKLAGFGNNTQRAPGTTVGVYGTNFTPSSTVWLRKENTIGHTQVPATVVDATTITFVVPTGLSGRYFVQVRSEWGANPGTDRQLESFSTD